MNESLNKPKRPFRKAKRNEGMWASPFTVENAKEIKKLLSKPITFEELNSEEGQQLLWNVIGDDKFWDGVENMAIDFPKNDAREWIADVLEDWIAKAENIIKDAISNINESVIDECEDLLNITESSKKSPFRKAKRNESDEGFKEVPVVFDDTDFINSVIFELNRKGFIKCYLINDDIDGVVGYVFYDPIKFNSKIDYSSLTGGDEELKRAWNRLDLDKIKEEVIKIIPKDLINTFNRKAESKLNESYDYPKALTNALRKCWFGGGKNAGMYARNGRWEIGLGGYDTGYEVSFDGTPLFAIRTSWSENVVDMYQSEEKIIKKCGYNFEQIMRALKEVEPELEIRESKIQIDEDVLKVLNEKKDIVYRLQNIKTGHTIWSHTKRMPGYKWTGEQSTNVEPSYSDDYPSGLHGGYYENCFLVDTEGRVQLSDYNPTEEELQKIIQFEKEAEESIENDGLERADIKEFIANESKLNESDEKLAQIISDEIDKLGFEDCLSAQGCCFVREGNYKHKISYDGVSLIYTNDKDKERRKFIVKNTDDVKKAFKEIAEIVEGME